MRKNYPELFYCSLVMVAGVILWIVAMAQAVTR